MKVQELFNLTIPLIDELDNAGKITPNNTKDYAYRTPAILSILQAENINKNDYKDPNTGFVTIPTLSSMEDELAVDDHVATTVLIYGLAAQLVATEKKSLAAFFSEKYTENKFLLNSETEETEIQDVFKYRVW